MQFPRWTALSLAVVTLTACGSDNEDSEPTSRQGTAAEEQRPASTPAGVNPAQFSKFKLGKARRAQLERRLGRPARTSKQKGGGVCLDYPAVDETGAPSPGLTYRFCFKQDKLVLRTTIATAQ